MQVQGSVIHHGVAVQAVQHQVGIADIGRIDVDVGINIGGYQYGYYGVCRSCALLFHGAFQVYFVVAVTEADAVAGRGCRAVCRTGKHGSCQLVDVYGVAGYIKEYSKGLRLATRCQRLLDVGNLAGDGKVA